MKQLPATRQSIFWDKSRPYPIWVPIASICWLTIVALEFSGKAHLMVLFGSAAFKQIYDASLFGIVKASAAQVAQANAAATSGAVSVALTNFSAIASASGSLLGFLIAAATIFLTSPAEGLVKRFAENELLVPLFGTYIRAVVATTFTLMFSLTSMFLKIGINNFNVEYILQAATLISLTFTFVFLGQTIKVLSDAGTDVTSNLQQKAKEEQLKKISDLQEQVGKTGTV